MELSFSNSCLKRSLLSAQAPVPYAAIARAGGGEIGRGAQQAAATLGAEGDLAAAASCGIRWRYKRSGTIWVVYYIGKRRWCGSGWEKRRQRKAGLVLIARVWTASPAAWTSRWFGEGFYGFFIYIIYKEVAARRWARWREEIGDEVPAR